MIFGAAKTAHQEGPHTFNLQSMPGEVGEQKEALLKRAEFTKSICAILVGNGKRDSLQLILRQIKESG